MNAFLNNAPAVKTEEAKRITRLANAKSKRQKNMMKPGPVMVHRVQDGIIQKQFAA